MKNIFKWGLILFVGGLIITSCMASAVVKKEEMSKLQNYFNKYSNLDEADAVDYNFDDKFTFVNGSELKLDVIFGDIEILESQDNDLHVTLSSRIHKDLKPIDNKKIVYQEGNQVHINLMDLFNDKNGSSNFIKINDHSIIISKSLKLKIAIPQQYKIFKIDSVSADYSIKNISLEQLNINNVSGDMRLDQVKSKSTHVNTVSGDIEFKDQQMNQIKLDTISGDILFKVKDPKDLLVKVTSVSGDLEGDAYFEKYISEDTLKLGEPKTKITIDSISGDIEFLKK